MRGSSISSLSQSHDDDREEDCSTDSSEHLEKLAHAWPEPCKYQIPISGQCKTDATEQGPRIVRPLVKAGLPTSYNHNERFELRERIAIQPSSWPKAMMFSPDEETIPSPVVLRTYSSPSLLGKHFSYHLPGSASHAGPARQYSYPSTSTTVTTTTANGKETVECSGRSSSTSGENSPDTPHMSLPRPKRLGNGQKINSTATSRPLGLQLQSPVPSLTTAFDHEDPKLAIAKSASNQRNTIPTVRLTETSVDHESGYFDPVNGCETMFVPRPRLRCQSLGQPNLRKIAAPERFWSTNIIKMPTNASRDIHESDVTGTKIKEPTTGIEFVVDRSEILEHERQQWRRQHRQSFGADSAVSRALIRRARSHNALVPLVSAGQLSIGCSLKAAVVETPRARRNLLRPESDSHPTRIRAARIDPDLCPDRRSNDTYQDVHKTFCIPSDKRIKGAFRGCGAGNSSAGIEAVAESRLNRGSLTERKIVSDEPVIIGKPRSAQRVAATTNRVLGATSDRRVFSLSASDLPDLQTPDFRQNKPAIKVVRSSTSLSLDELQTRRVAGWTSAAEASASVMQFLAPPPSLKRLVGHGDIGLDFSRSASRRVLTPLSLSPRSSLYSSERAARSHSKPSVTPVSPATCETPVSPELWHANTLTPDSLFFRPLSELYR